MRPIYTVEIMTGMAFDSVLYRLLLPNSPLDKGLPVLEAAVRRCFSKWVFLKISQYSHKNNCVEVSF